MGDTSNSLNAVLGGIVRLVISRRDGSNLTTRDDNCVDPIAVLESGSGVKRKIPSLARSL
jgi:hypothetical protein